jgi:glycosyltransferase involved in cell wall biosynthesis
VEKQVQHICFLISSLGNAGGTERVCTAIANKLSHLNYTVTVISMYAAEPFFPLDGAVNYLALYPKKQWSKIRIPFTVMRLRQMLAQQRVSILINVDSALFIYSGAATIGLNIRNVLWEHFHYNARGESLARSLSRKLGAQYSDAIITLTDADKSVWSKQSNHQKKIFTINNPSPFLPADVDYTIIRKPIVLSVGRLNEQKGFDLLIDAWYTVKQQQLASWELHIVGSGELKNDLQQKVASYGLSGSVKLIPATSNIKHHYQQASLYCLSSRYEGYPMVLLEAQTFGLPVVSFDCETGPAEIIKNYQTGLLVKAGDISALAKAILHLISDADQRASMGQLARKNAEGFDIDYIIKHWLKLFTALSTQL